MQNSRVVAYRKRRKLWAVEAFGGKCGICGYSKCLEALHFHHLDPKIKKFSFSGSTVKRELYVEELKKCICVCANCHNEIHANITKIPSNILRFNENYAKKQIPEKLKHPCKYCGKSVAIEQKYCSLNCSRKDRELIDWPNIDELKQLVLENGYRGTGRILGISDNAIRKRIKRNSKPQIVN